MINYKKRTTEDAMKKRLKRIFDDRFRELFVRASAVLGLVTVVGMLANILILVLGYLIALPHLFDYLEGYFMTLNNTGLWILYGGLSLAFCILLNGIFLTHIGSSAACWQKYDPASDFWRDMLISVGAGCGVHGLLCWIVGKMGLPYLFFAGPVQYIARLIGDGDRSLFADMSYSFPGWVITVSVLIYTAFVFAGCLGGYRIGYRKKRAMIEAADAESRRGTSPEKTWSAADAKQTPWAYRPDQRP